MPRMFRRNKQVDWTFLMHTSIYISMLATAVSPEDGVHVYIYIYNFNSASPMLTITQTLVCKKSVWTLDWVSLFVGIKPGKSGNVGLKNE